MIVDRLMPVTLATALAFGCSSGKRSPGGTDVQDRDEPGPASSAADSSAPPRETLHALEARLLRAPAAGIRYTIRAEGVITASLTGTLRLGAGSEVELLARGTFAEAAVTLSLRSDGRRMEGGSGERTFRGGAPPALREALVIGLTRMGLLHNLARLSAGSPPDHAEGGVSEWVRVGEVKGDDAPGLLDAGLVELGFPIFVSGKRSAEATLWMDLASGLPLRREQVVRFPNGEMRVVEEYEPLPGVPEPAQ